MLELNIEYHILIKGRVQGVGFRWFTQTLAEKLGVFGWVRNNYDGTVEIIAQGPEDILDDFINKLKSGPPSANVSSLEKEKRNIIKEYKNFQVAY